MANGPETWTHVGTWCLQLHHMEKALHSMHSRNADADELRNEITRLVRQLHGSFMAALWQLVPALVLRPLRVVAMPTEPHGLA